MVGRRQLPTGACSPANHINNTIQATYGGNNGIVTTGSSPNRIVIPAVSLAGLQGSSAEERALTALTLRKNCPWIWHGYRDCHAIRQNIHLIPERPPDVADLASVQAGSSKMETRQWIQAPIRRNRTSIIKNRKPKYPPQSHESRGSYRHHSHEYNPVRTTSGPHFNLSREDHRWPPLPPEILL